MVPLAAAVGIGKDCELTERGENRERMNRALIMLEFAIVVDGTVARLFYDNRIRDLCQQETLENTNVCKEPISKF